MLVIIVYLFFHLDDWRCDQYRWINQGVTKQPRKDPKIQKMYFDADTPKGPSKTFQRHGYHLIGDKTYTLLHYLGDEGAAVDFCHRSSKHREHQFFARMCPSQMKKFKDLCAVDKANVVYKREVHVASLHHDPELVPVKALRNMKQLRNGRYSQLQRLRFSRDDLYNLHEIAYDIPGFTRKITTFSDLVCVCGLQESKLQLYITVINNLHTIFTMFHAVLM